MAFSVYIHLPYCLHKCPYCDFNTYAVRNFPERRYADALVRELETAAHTPTWQGRRVATLFFGGGTPSLFSPGTIGRLVDTIDTLFGFDDGAEISLEANPGSLEGGARAKLAGFRRAGVGRLSLGGQPFNAQHRATLGRIHGADETTTALEAARLAGFESVSCDLIFAVPGQTLQQWEEDLARLCALAPDHVSTYGLTYESGTRMTAARDAGSIHAACEDLERTMFERAIDRLEDAGYRQYEISNFARPGHQARHNLAYWTWRDYLGVGAGAHGFARLAPTLAPTLAPSVARQREAGGEQPAFGSRYANLRLPEEYMTARAGGWIANTELLDRDMAMAEFVMLGLRLTRGLCEQTFADLFGQDFAEATPPLAGLAAGGLVRR